MVHSRTEKLYGKQRQENCRGLTDTSMFKVKVCTATAHKAVKQQRSVVTTIKMDLVSSFGKPQKDLLRAQCVDTIMLHINKHNKHIQ